MTPPIINLEYKGIELGHSIPEKAVLEYKSEKFKQKYFHTKEFFENNINKAENYLRQAEHGITQLILKHTAKYKAALQVLRTEALKNTDITTQQEKQQQAADAFINEMTHNDTIEELTNKDNFSKN